MSRPRFIHLPKNPTLHLKFSRELQEIEDSMPDGIENLDDWLACCKYVVIQFLLESPDGMVDTEYILASMKQIDEDIKNDLENYPHIFDAACLVIDRNCKKYS